MLTLIFLVCSTTSNYCYSATSGVTYDNKEECTESAVVIIDRNYASQKQKGELTEIAVFKCISWGEPA
jgi:hypothetical protein